MPDHISQEKRSWVEGQMKHKKKAQQREKKSDRRSKRDDKALRRELQLDTFPLDCRRQLALWLLHKGNTRLGRDDKKQRATKGKGKTGFVFKRQEAVWT